MNSVKTYNKINKNDDLNFSISKMEDIYDSRQGATDEPHRHDYYAVLIVKKLMALSIKLILKVTN